MKLLNIGQGNEDSEHEVESPEPQKKTKEVPHVTESTQAQKDQAKPKAVSPKFADFSKAYNSAVKIVKHGLPTIPGNASEKEIEEAIAKIEAMVKEAS
jgi:hypothetical protein